MQFFRLFTVVFFFSFALLAVVGLSTGILDADAPQMFGVAALAALQALAVAVLEATARSQRQLRGDRPSVLGA